MKSLILCGACAAAAAAALATTPAQALGHFDVAPRFDGVRIVTDAHDDAAPPGTPDMPDVRVFGYDFQEDPLDPYFAGDPGFNARAGSGLPAGTQLRFNVLSGGGFGLPANLTYWDGTGPVEFGAVPSSETLRLNLGGQDRLVGSGNGDIAGFSIGTVASDGSLHRHLGSFLNGSDGNNDPTDGFPPADGIYLIAMELTSSDISVGDSLPMFVIYNNGLSEAVHDEAIEFVTTNVVPEPTGMAVLLPLGAMLMRRRNRHTKT